MGAAVDLLLLHPPSVYDFRKQPILYGPVSDVVPSSTVFEMYPVGFLTMAAYLEDRGLSVRIVNLALRMMNDRDFDVPAFLASVKPKAVGIDLHWLPHAHGALEVARLVKEAHPTVPVVMGGLSASYFHAELVRSPHVDYVLRGDSTEPPLHALLTALSDGTSVANISNLTWKLDGEVMVNPLTFVPATLDYVDLRPELLMDMVVRYRDVTSVLPFKRWWANPMSMVLPLKGCAYECTTCGASRSACNLITHRKKPVFRSPSSLADNVANMAKITRGPIFLPGDILQGGRAYAAEVVDRLAASQVRNELVFEFFDLPPIEHVEHLDRALPSWSFEISPESHDHEVRRAQEGEVGYSNEELEALLKRTLELKCRRADVFFMIGLPKQTHQSVLEMVEYCGRLLAMGDRVSCFITPMGPFLDPGSRIFEDPERFGYTLFARTLEEHRQLLLQPSW
jgi:B12-binding domain/radical SAM domain protein